MRLRSRAASRWIGFRKSIFSEMTDLAERFDAVNLAQGFPDEPGPSRVLELMRRNLENGAHQYAPSIGESALRIAVAENVFASTGICFDASSEVTITTGATEAIYSVVNAFVNPGDRVLMFDPAFDTYAQAVANAGGVIVPVTLHAPDSPLGQRVGDWAVDWEEFDAVSSAGFSFMIFNSPHNPTAKVFSFEELERIARAVAKNGAIVLTDEVYEHIIFDGAEHVSLLAFADIRNQVVRVSSAAKTFGFTGFKLGWVTASRELSEVIRLVHQATVFCTPSHIQCTFAEIMSDTNWTQEWVKTQKKKLLNNRCRLERVLTKAGFALTPTRGTYYLLANYEQLQPEPDGMRFARFLVERCRVASIPVSAFFETSPRQFFWLRFAFCKSRESIDRAAQLLGDNPPSVVLSEKATKLQHNSF
jgi:aspartate/methionine/tyrosine aminotransferase